ncbi:malic enzyme-like NAD(P)-binding protein [Streptomyces sp. CB03911]|uniref:NAD(P)-dependent malic enzyme n=1 Tax=Streptomycetaceae TaxID=2062 RepID=UPI00093F0F4E|nr:malic enzyme-like NAD(P)-binding protein [Streptomyces sp. CB03911]OKI26168.1 malate dehydrogenase [Streptomyces sp. CB03911]
MSATAEPDDPVLDLHLGGKLEVRATVPLRNREDLARVYTPGFTRVAREIARDAAAADRWTIRRNTVAVVTDGSAVSGLGDLGPLAALPVMEGKALLFKEFAGIDAFPICLATKDVDEIVRTVTHLEPTFGGIMLEDISAPRCFEIEDRLRERLSIPVLHDDQHATAVAAAAALVNAAKLVGKAVGELKVVVAGVGAAGTSTARLFMSVGVRHIVVCDRQGALHRGRTGLTGAKAWFAEHTNPGQERGSLRAVLAGADVFVGFAGRGVLDPEDLRTMAARPVVFALSNPYPEFMPEEVRDIVAVLATGRSDLPNQIDCGLCYPGIFRGAFDAGARSITEEMKAAAALAIAGLVDDEALDQGRIVPDIFDGVARHVAKAVAEAATAPGTAPRVLPL